MWNPMNKKENNTKMADETVDNSLEDALEKSIKEESEVHTEEATEGVAVDTVEKLEEDVKKEKEKFLRLFAEFENYKKRTTRERIELFKTANQEVLQAILPVLDDFDRALQAITEEETSELSKGVSLIHNKLKETVKNKGLEEVTVTKGDAFDAEIHEAITQIPAPEPSLKGKIVDVVEKGYKLGGKNYSFSKSSDRKLGVRATVVNHIY